ncbi:MAG: hypothetical protein ABIL09_24230 [Gemmatimonadota bacterium]
MGKAPAKRRPKPRRPASRLSRGLLLGLLPLVAVALVWLAWTTAQERMWRDLRDAGHRAYQRGSYDYAQRIYREALQQAEALDPTGRRVVLSLQDLGRLYEARGLSDSAALVRQQALSIERGP